MTKTQKSIGKKVAVGLVAVVMAGTLMSTGFSSGLSAAANVESKGKYYADFKSYEEEQEYASQHNIKLEEESIVLLKNKDNALPLGKNSKNISMFSSVNYRVSNPTKREGPTENKVTPDGIIYGGTGSGQGVGTFLTMPEEFANAGFKLNPQLKAVYESVDNCQIVSGTIGGSMISRTEIKVDNIKTEAIAASYAHYDGALVATIARHAGEGQNLWTRNVPTHSNKDDHYLQLDDNEKALLAHLKEVKKTTGAPIIYLLNTANPLELAELEDDDDIDAIVWIGFPGTTGLNAVPRVLTGEVNPSGRLVDTYVANFKHDPTWFNHNPEFVNITDGQTADEQREEKYPLAEGQGYSARTNLDEGIYVDYRWYETAAATTVDGKTVLEKIGVYDEDKATIPADKDGDAFYNRSTGVVYPFGYGLSYTTFSQKILTDGSKLAKAINKAKNLDTKVDVKVEVTNTGNVAGKEVVQLYVNAPYTAGGIEKAYRTLVSFGKTEELKPGETTVVSLEVRLGDIASFDYNDANTNGFYGYEIEAGNYKFELMKNSHEKLGEITSALTAKTKDLYEGVNIADANEARIPLSEVKDAAKANLWNCSATLQYAKDQKLVTREDLVGTFPVYPSYILNDIDEYYTKYTRSRYTDHPYTEFNDNEEDAWYITTADIPATWTQATEHAEGYTDVTIKLKDMGGLDYTDNTTVLTQKDTHVAEFVGKTPKQAWDIFMNQLTYKEMADFISDCGFHLNGMDSIGKELTLENDGPAQLNYNAINVTRTASGSRYGGTWSGGGRSGWFWCSEVNIASTWNTDLAYEQGVLIGNEGLFSSVTAWYGPGVQVHRSPFIGRNFEYYSGDGLQGGFIAAAVIGGAQSKGLTCYMKHYGFLAPNTGGEVITEQAAREVHLKPYEYAIKFGDCQGIMTVSDMCGAAGTSNYALNVALACDEWGFKGVTITDWYGTYCGYANFNQRNGVTIPLNNYGGVNVIGGQWDATKTRADGGKGMLMENQKWNPTGGDDRKGAMETVEAIEAPNTWFYTRLAAERVLWVAANGSANYNGLDKSAVVDKTITINKSTDGTVAVASIALDKAALDKFGTNKCYYEIKRGSLPAGLTLDRETGLIYGNTTADAGDYTLTIVVYGDGFYAVQHQLTVKVENTITAGGIQFKEADGKLQYSADGTTWTDVATASGVNGADGKGIKSITKTGTEGLVDTYTITYTDDTTSTFTITNGKDGVNGTNGKDGENGKDGSGCGSAITATGATAAALAVVLAGVVIGRAVSRKKEN